MISGYFLSLIGSALVASDDLSSGSGIAKFFALPSLLSFFYGLLLILIGIGLSLKPRPAHGRGCPLAQRVPIYLKPRTSRESGICLVRRPVSESSIRNAPPVSNISSTSANVPTSRP
jgi:hypothetical protein